MVATSNIALLRKRQVGDPPSIHAATDDLTVDLDPRVVAEFSTTGARDTAYAAAIAGTTPYVAAKKGMRCYVHSGPGGFPDWCGWNGTEWIFDRPLPVTYYSGSIAGTIITQTAPTGHIPSVYSFTPSRSGFAEVRVVIAAGSSTAGYGSGYLRARYSSGTLLPGGTSYTAIEDLVSLTRKDTVHHFPVPIYLTKNVVTELAFDLWKANASGAWQLVSAQWQITQV